MRGLFRTEAGSALQRSWAWPLGFLCCCAVILGCTKSLVVTGAEGPNAQAGSRPPLNVRAGVDRGSATVGDKIRLTIEIEYDAGIEVKELVHQDLLGDLEVVEFGRTVLRQVRGRGGLVEWVVLRADTVGSYIVPSLEVSGSDANGTPQSAFTDEVFVEILSVLPEGGAEDIRGLKSLEEDQDLMFWWVIAGIGLLVALLFWRWHRARTELEEVPSLAAHELAFRDLEALRGVDFSDLKQLRGYYFSLSAILRRYVEGRFGFNATDLTSEEIAGRIDEGDPMSSDQESTLLTFLEATDSVKYAAEIPGRRQIEEVYESALGFVETTVPQQEEADAESASGETAAAEGGEVEPKEVGRLTVEPEPKSQGTERNLHRVGGSTREANDDERFMPR